MVSAGRRRRVSSYTAPRCQVIGEYQFECGCWSWAVACPPTGRYPQGRVVAASWEHLASWWRCECGWTKNTSHVPCAHMRAVIADLDGRGLLDRQGERHG